MSAKISLILCVLYYGGVLETQFYTNHCYLLTDQNYLDLTHMPNSNQTPQNDTFDKNAASPEAGCVIYNRIFWKVLSFTDIYALLMEILRLLNSFWGIFGHGNMIIWLHLQKINGYKLNLYEMWAIGQGSTGDLQVWKSPYPFLPCWS